MSTWVKRKHEYKLLTKRVSLASVKKKVGSGAWEQGYRVSLDKNAWGNMKPHACSVEELGKTLALTAMHGLTNKLHA